MTPAPKEPMWRRLWGLPIYAWLLALYPIVSIAGSNSGEVALRSVLAATVVATVTVAFLHVVYRLLLGTWQKAALACAVTALVFYMFGPVSLAIASWLERVGGETGALGVADRVLLLLSIAWMLILGAGVWLVRKIPDRHSVRVAGPLNFVATALFGLAVLQGAARWTPAPVGLDEPTSVGRPTAARPDIYYIVLDGYARGDVLAEHYGHDNGPFLDELRSLGFSINDRGFANYYWTFLSLASSLNMNYLPSIFGDGFDANDSSAATYHVIRNNAVARALRQNGYRFVQLQSTWGATFSNPYADVVLPCGGGPFTDEFFRALAEASWLRVLTPQSNVQLADCHRTNLESLARLGGEPGPKFVFAHFLLPHHPYLFDRNGNIRRNATIANQFDYQARLWEKRDEYLEQLLWVNQAVLRTVRAIQSASAEPPLILLQSDHGPQLNRGLDTAERRRIRLANFAAYYLPGAPPDLIPSGDSPVNLFRRVLSFYLDADTPSLENRHFYSTFRRQLDLEDVTDIVYEKSGNGHSVGERSVDVAGNND